MQRRYRKPKPKKDLIKKFRINEMINTPELMIIDDQGKNLGVLKLSAAIQAAQNKDMDLVEVYPLAKPPVAKIMNYGQYKYETEKKLRKSKAHQKTSELKSIRLSFRIKGKDLETKLNQAAKFLADGNKVKIDINLKGREKAHKDIALKKIQEFINALGKNIKVVQPVSSQGGQITTTINKQS